MMRDKSINEPVRVLHVVTTMNRGGLETMLMNYYRHIDRQEVQFDFLEHRDTKSDYDQEILSLGGKIYRLPKLNPFSISYHRKLNTFFHEHQEYRIVHVHQDCLSSIALKAAYQKHVPVRIAHSHNASQDKNLKYIFKRYYMKKIPKYATHLFACSKEAGDWMFLGKNYQIVRNAIDTKKFLFDEGKRWYVRKKLGIPDFKLVVGHVGRFNFSKNHDFLIDIFYEIQRINENSVLLLVGVGDLEQSIKEKVDKKGLSQKVMFLGKRSDVNDLMQAMDIFIFPSNYEGLPVTLVEAQAAGLPIIKSDHVSNQCKITPYIYTLSLNSSPYDWANKAIQIVNHSSRGNTLKYLIESHYDIYSNAVWLKDFYLSEGEKYGN